MQRKTLVIVVVLLAAATLAASAYSTASVSRDASINVVTDDVGLIALEDGSSSDLIAQDTSGELSIDMTKGGANGVNVDSKFVFGDSADVTNDNAFNITNQDTQQQTLDISYTLTGTDGDANSDQLQFDVYQYNSTSGAYESVAVVNEDGTAQSVTLDAAETVIVVLTIDVTGIDSSADYSGTLDISA